MISILKINRVYQGDCLEVMKNIEGKSIDMILCDLPYGTTACKWDSVIPFEPLWGQYKRIIKENGAIVLFGSQPFTSKLIVSNLEWFKYEWIWDKVNPSGFNHARLRPMKEHENILVFCRSRVNYYPIKIKRDKIKKSRHYGKNSQSNPLTNIDSKNRTYAHYNPKTILKFSNANRTNRIHPTQKPVPLCEYLIRTYTNEGELVLDNCCGSGTTGVACIKSKRNYILIEQEEKYVEIAIQRLKLAEYEYGNTLF